MQKVGDIVNTYEKVSKNPTAKLEKETTQFMKTTLKSKFPDDYLHERLFLQNTRTAELCGLPKTHKTGNPLRPIVFACCNHFGKASWFLQCILTQLLSLIPAYLLNTNSFLTKLIRDYFPMGSTSGSTVFTLDVTNL